jgi:hypothetical protein
MTIETKGDAETKNQQIKIHPAYSIKYLNIFIQILRISL